MVREQNSLLTEGQREWLTGDEYDDPDAERMAKRRLRERVGHGIRDVSLLLDEWPDAERADTFDTGNWLWTSSSVGWDTDRYPANDLHQGVLDTVAFAWLAVLDAGGDPREVFETGIRKAARRAYPGYQVNIDLSVALIESEPDPEYAMRKMRTGQELDPDEQAALLESGAVPPDTLAEYVRGEIETWSPDEE